MFAFVHDFGELWPARAKLVGDTPPRLDDVLAVGLIERMPDRARDDRMLSLRHMSECVANPVHTAALPGGGGIGESIPLACQDVSLR